MLFAPLLLAAGNVAGGPAVAHPATDATFGCVFHVFDASPLNVTNVKRIKAEGLENIFNPPAGKVDDVRKQIPASWGQPYFTRAAYSSTEFWAIGFDGGNCLVDGSGADFEAMKAEVLSVFGQGTPWQKLPPTEVASDRFGLRVTPPGKKSRDIVVNIVYSPPVGKNGRIVATFEILDCGTCHGPSL